MTERTIRRQFLLITTPSEFVKLWKQLYNYHASNFNNHTVGVDCSVLPPVDHPAVTWHEILTKRRLDKEATYDLTPTSTSKSHSVHRRSPTIQSYTGAFYNAVAGTITMRRRAEVDCIGIRNPSDWKPIPCLMYSLRSSRTRTMTACRSIFRYPSVNYDVNARGRLVSRSGRPPQSHADVARSASARSVPKRKDACTRRVAYEVTWWRIARVVWVFNSDTVVGM